MSSCGNKPRADAASRVVSIRLSPKEIRHAAEAAQFRGIHLSDFVRDAIMAAAAVRLTERELRRAKKAAGVNHLDLRDFFQESILTACSDCLEDDDDGTTTSRLAS